MRRCVIRSFMRRITISMYYIYILQSKKDKSYYTGFTLNLKERIEYHNAGQQKYTKSKTPWQLKWYCVFKNKQRALKFEQYLKSGSGNAFAKKRLL